jgi:putative addiction module killer protein
MFRVDSYRTATGRVPFQVWLDSIRDRGALSTIYVRLARARQGNLGDYRSVGDGVFELRIFVRPGYRIYFGLPSPAQVMLLTGGTKHTQWQDIRKAKALYAEYLERES